jgi:hypothetical protein
VALRPRLSPGVPLSSEDVLQSGTRYHPGPHPSRSMNLKLCLQSIMMPMLQVLADGRQSTASRLRARYGKPGQTSRHGGAAGGRGLRSPLQSDPSARIFAALRQLSIGFEREGAVSV